MPRTSITGSLPASIGNMPSLEMVWLDHNPKLGGPIPQTFANLKNLVAFEGDEVIFADGTRTAADVVLFAHGYAPTFPFLKYPVHVGARHPGLLYLNMFHPVLGGSLAFCGFARPAIGTIPPTGELQARLFAQVAAGLRELPDAAEMSADVDMERKENQERYPTQPQPNVVISWIDYMDRLAGIVGCRPDIRRLLLRPRLLWKVAAGPMTGAVYRLHGPGAAPASETTVLWLPRMHHLREVFTLLGLHLLIWPFVRTHPSVRWRSANPII